MARWVNISSVPPGQLMIPSLANPEGQSCSPVGSYTSFMEYGRTYYYICQADSGGGTTPDPGGGATGIKLNSSSVDVIMLNNNNVLKVTLDGNTVFTGSQTASISGISYTFGNWENSNRSEFRLVTMGFTLTMGDTTRVYWKTDGNPDGPYATSGSFTSGGSKTISVVGWDDINDVRITIRRDSSSGPIIFDEYV